MGSRLPLATRTTSSWRTSTSPPDRMRSRRHHRPAPEPSGSLRLATAESVRRRKGSSRCKWMRNRSTSRSTQETWPTATRTPADAGSYTQYRRLGVRRLSPLAALAPNLPGDRESRRGDWICSRLSRCICAAGKWRPAGLPGSCRALLQLRLRSGTLRRARHRAGIHGSGPSPGPTGVARGGPVVDEPTLADRDRPQTAVQRLGRTRIGLGSAPGILARVRAAWRATGHQRRRP